MKRKKNHVRPSNDIPGLPPAVVSHSSHPWKNHETNPAPKTLWGYIKYALGIGEENS